MIKTHSKFGTIFLIIVLLSGCMTTKDPLVRWWNDGFLYSEKEGEENMECSRLASKSYPVSSPNGDNTQWHKLHDECMRKKGY